MLCRLGQPKVTRPVKDFRGPAWQRWARQLVLPHGSSPIDLEFVDDTFDTVELFQNLLGDLLLKEGSDLPVQDDYPGFFLAENVVSSQMRAVLDRGIDSHEQFSRSGLRVIGHETSPMCSLVLMEPDLSEFG